MYVSEISYDVHPIKIVLIGKKNFKYRGVCFIFLKVFEVQIYTTFVKNSEN